MDEDRQSSLLAILCGKAEKYHTSVFAPHMARVLGVQDQSKVVETIHSDEAALLRALLGFYGFARKGGERAGYADIAVAALNSSLDACGGYKQAMRSKGFGDAVWGEFLKNCKAKGIAPNQKLNKGVVLGFVDLAHEARGSFVEWIRRALGADIEMLFLILSGIKGLGPKISCFLLRDLAWIFEIEDQLSPEKRLFLQPVDVWVRRTAYELWQEFGDDTEWWLIALRIASTCYAHGLSGIFFNQGSWYFGAREVKDAARFSREFAKLTTR